MGIWKFVGIQDNYPKIVVTMQEMETAFIISGKNIKKGLRFDDVSMMQYDVA